MPHGCVQILVCLLITSMETRAWYHVHENRGITLSRDFMDVVRAENSHLGWKCIEIYEQLVNS